MKIYRLALLGSALTVVLAGCGGEQKWNTTGRVMKGGAPFTAPETDSVEVTFMAVGGEPGASHPLYGATYNNNEGSFKVLGNDLKGLPKGKYQVAVYHLRKKKDLFKGAYDFDNSAFFVEVNSKDQQVVIDLDSKN